MNISEMSDQKKSVMLARLCGWSTPAQMIGTKTSHIVSDSEGKPVWIGGTFDLYNDRWMNMAWRVLNWAVSTPDNQMMLDSLREDYFMEDIEQYGQLSPADAQRAWLDKILELAIESGMVE